MGAVVFLAGFWAVAGVLLAVLEGIPELAMRVREWRKDRRMIKQLRMRRCYR
jgi:hypothetical protein